MRLTVFVLDVFFYLFRFCLPRKINCILCYNFICTIKVHIEVYAPNQLGSPNFEFYVNPEA